MLAIDNYKGPFTKHWTNTVFFLGAQLDFVWIRDIGTFQLSNGKSSIINKLKQQFVINVMYLETNELLLSQWDSRLILKINRLYLFISFVLNWIN